MKLALLKPLFVAITLGLLLLITGCSKKSIQLTSEKDDSRFTQAQQLIKEGQYEAALSNFLKIIATRDQAPESHLEAGQLYLTIHNDPISAIHHFRQFILIHPDSGQTKTVYQMIETAKKAFLRQLPGHLLADNPNLQANLMNTLQQIREENNQLRSQVADLQEKLKQNPTPQTRSMPAIPMAKSQPRVSDQTTTEYTIEAGDTLARISQKVYGTPHRWKEILKANRNQLPNIKHLKVGKILSIPR